MPILPQFKQRVSVRFTQNINEQLLVVVFRDKRLGRTAHLPHKLTRSSRDRLFRALNLPCWIPVGKIEVSRSLFPKVELMCTDENGVNDGTR